MAFILQDARFGARILLRTPAITICIILLLALGIGANSAMFSVVDGLLLHPVRYEDPGKLVFVWSHDPQGTLSDVSPADFMDIRARSTALGDFATWMPTTFVVIGGERPRQLGGARVTANFFQTLGVKPVLGRTFLPQEDGLDNPANAAHSVVVSYRMWMQDLAGDPNVLGRILRVDSAPYTIVGVAPADFRFWWSPHDLWIPVSMNIHERDYHDQVVIARLKSGRAQAAAELNSIARALAQEFPKSDLGWTLHVEDLKERLLNQTFRLRLLLLSGSVGLVLLLACSNVASLLLARSAARQREIAIRTSLGATVGRLAQQFLTESALLALIGGAAGLLMAWALIRMAPRFVPAEAIPGGALALSMPVVWFTLGLSVLTCLLIGFAPVAGIAGLQTQSGLKPIGRGTTAGRASRRVREGIIAAEVATALILLAGAWLMSSSLRNLARVDPGFDPSNVLTVRLFLPASKYNAGQALQFYRLGVQRMAGLPGVQSVATSTTLPLLNKDIMEVRFDRDGSARSEAERPSSAYAAVGQQYFSVLRIRLLRGRLFSEADNENAPLVAIVSEEFAARYFPNEDPIGKRIEVSRPVPLKSSEEMVKPEIVGVVANVKMSDLASDPGLMIYVPHPQNPFSRGVWFAARVAGPPLSLAGAVRREFMTIDREQPVEQISTMDQTLAGQLAQPKFQTELMASFAVVALLLSVLGIYGVNSYAVTQRRNELGLRMALGASRGAILRLVIGQGMLPTGAGIIAGLIGAATSASVLRSILVGADALNPLAFLGAALILTAAAVVACYIPARRATRIDPAVSLRIE